LIICDAVLRESAVNYCHDGVLHMDGTFGLCDSKLLLFVLYALDDASKGKSSPFAAAVANGSTQACRLASCCSQHLRITALPPPDTTPPSWSSFSDAAGVAVNVTVAMTDSDVKERTALVTVWHNVELLLCTRHLRECWKHRRNQGSSFPCFGLDCYNGDARRFFVSPKTGRL
jgi:hypothetical protein